MFSSSRHLHQEPSNFSYDPDAVRLTKHAARRAQQRAISTAAIPIVRAFGRRQHDGRGAVIYMMTNNAMDSLIRAVGRTPLIERLEGVYVVVSLDTDRVITMGHSF